MVLALGEMNSIKNLSEADHSKMINYIRTKEYINGLRDSLSIMQHSKTLEESIGNINILIEFCEEMKYHSIRDVFALQ